MKRRQLLGLGAIGLLGPWALRPADSGQAHGGYFARLNQLLLREGGGAAQLLVDLERLDHNAALLARRLAGRQALRLVVKSLACSGLLEYLSGRLATRRFMAFSQPQLNRLAQAFPDADLLLGQPLPVAAALAFYQRLARSAGFDPAQQLTWLIDSRQRLADYAQLARALGQPLQIAFEIDVGLARGGFASPPRLGEALNWLNEQPAPLRVRGLMGYDAQVARPPFWLGQARAFGQSCRRYRTFVATARSFSGLWPHRPLLNGAGSQTYALHVAGDSPLNELAVGSALLKPGDCDTPLLAAHQPALWIASPVLKAQTGALPFLAGSQALLQGWNRNRQRAFYLDGGWPAEPVSPAGLSHDPFYDPGPGQQRLIGSRATGLTVNDWVFLRPRRAQGLPNDFDSLRLLRHGRLVGRWSAHDGL